MQTIQSHTLGGAAGERSASPHARSTEPRTSVLGTLGYLFVRRGSALLRCTSGSRGWTLLVLGGLPVSASATHDGERLGQIMVRSGTLDARTLAQALGTQARAPGMSLGTILERQGLAPRSACRAAIRQQLQRALVQMASWGRHRTTVGELPPAPLGGRTVHRFRLDDLFEQAVAARCAAGLEEDLRRSAKRPVVSRVPVTAAARLGASYVDILVDAEVPRPLGELLRRQPGDIGTFGAVHRRILALLALGLLGPAPGPPSPEETEVV